MGAGREVWAKIRAGTGAHPRAGADRFEPEPDRPLGEHPQGERRGGGGDRASGFLSTLTPFCRWSGESCQRTPK